MEEFCWNKLKWNRLKWEFLWIINMLVVFVCFLVQLSEFIVLLMVSSVVCHI